MKNKKLWERIRVDRKIIEGLRLGKSINALIKELKKGKGYTIKVRDLGIEHGYLDCLLVGNKKTLRPTDKILPPFPEALFPYHDKRSDKTSESEEVLLSQKDWIIERLEAKWTPQTIYEELPKSVPRSNFYRFLKNQNLKKSKSSKNVLEIIHAPAECLQLDWGKLVDVIDEKTQKKKTVWIFIGTLGHSRFEMARLVERLDFATTIDALVSMFEEMGGVPKKLVIDNPKVFISEASKYEPVLNPAFERFASHYGIIVEALPPATPELKGKVERKVSGKRRVFESYDKSHYQLDTAQAHINKKLEMLNERKHGTHRLRPIDVFLNDEVNLLKALPILPYEAESVVISTIRKDGYVRFENKYYRVEPNLHGEDALVIGNTKQVTIYCKGKLLEVYERITDNFRTKACKDHYKEPWEKTLQDQGHYLKKASLIGKNVERFVSIVLSRGAGFVDTKVIWGLLTLNKTYKDEDIDKACLSALELEEVKLSTVRSLLNIMAKPKEQEKIIDEKKEGQTMGGKFVRPMDEYQRHLKLIQ